MDRKKCTRSPREPVTVTRDINDDFQRMHEKADDKDRIFDDGHRRNEQKQSDFLVILDFLKEKSERDGSPSNEAVSDSLPSRLSM